jgi:hypothetical protein
MYPNGFDRNIARQRLGKHFPTHAPHNYTMKAFSMWSEPRNGMSAVFAAWLVTRLYAAEIRLVEYRLVKSQD